MAGCSPVDCRYAPQASWILAATVRDNVLLGRPYEEAWYRRVVAGCALEADLASFARGDATEIGERRRDRLGHAHLPRISPASHLHLGCISVVSRQASAA